MVNSRNKGHSFELETMHEYRKWFPKCLTSRNESRSRDAEKVDLCYTDPFNIQCKNYANFSWAKAIETIKEMPDESNYNILHLKITRKGDLICMSKEDWYEIVWILKSNEII